MITVLHRYVHVECTDFLGTWNLCRYGCWGGGIAGEADISETVSQNDSWEYDNHYRDKMCITSA